MGPISRCRTREQTQKVTDLYPFPAVTANLPLRRASEIVGARQRALLRRPRCPVVHGLSSAHVFATLRRPEPSAARARLTHPAPTATRGCQALSGKFATSAADISWSCVFRDGLIHTPSLQSCRATFGRGCRYLFGASSAECKCGIWCARWLLRAYPACELHAAELMELALVLRRVQDMKQSHEQ